jgi:5-methylcytosine-specific restriction endonuclease McrA
MGRQIKGMRAFTSQQRRMIRADLIRKYGTNCQLCIKKGKSLKSAAIDMSVERDDKSFSIDHIVALADGGTNTPDNMWPTHIACNELKGSNAVAGRVRTNRQPRAERQNVTHVTGVRLAYSSSSY